MAGGKEVVEWWSDGAGTLSIEHFVFCIEKGRAARRRNTRKGEKQEGESGGGDFRFSIGDRSCREQELPWQSG